MMQRRAAQVLVLALGSLAGVVQADEAVFSGMAEVMTNQLGRVSRIQPKGASQLIRIFFHDDALRVEFDDVAGVHYALIHAKGAPMTWVVGKQGKALPVPSTDWPLRFDPEQPCANQGMFADCQFMATGVYAGRPARQWRYRLSNDTGPGLTRQGDMWLDAETGLVLAYRGRTALDRAQQWEVKQVRYGPQPEALFQPVPAPEQ